MQEPDTGWASGNYYVAFDTYHQPIKWPVFPNGNVIRGNWFYDPKLIPLIYYNEGNRVWTLQEVQSQYPFAFLNNVVGDPVFVDLDTLKPAKSLVGVDLTKVSVAGEGNIVEVVDASYFIDGWGIVEGDTIKIGGSIVKIVSLAGNKLTIDSKIKFDVGDSVNIFPHSGVGAVQ